MPSWRGSIRSEGKFTLNRYWTWGWDGTLTSDKTFPSHYLEDGRDVATSLAYLTGIHDRDYFSAQALYFQSLMPGIDQDLYPYSLPYVRHSVILDEPVWGGEMGFDWSAYLAARGLACGGETGNACAAALLQPDVQPTATLDDQGRRGVRDNHAHRPRMVAQGATP